MNFIDYCIATKNYSAISAVNEYSKMFGKYDDENGQNAFVIGKDGKIKDTYAVKDGIRYHERPSVKRNALNEHLGKDADPDKENLKNLLKSLHHYNKFGHNNKVKFDK